MQRNNYRTGIWTMLLTLALGLAQAPAQTQTNRPSPTKTSRWEPEIRAFQNRDRTNPPPQHAILFIGSSAIRLWKTLARDFAGLPVINRGFGGSQIVDSTAFAERIIFPYHPRQIVLYAGDNDLAAGKSPDEVVADYRAFVQTVRARLPETRIAFVSIKPSPSRWKLKDNIMAVNRQIAAMHGNGLSFIDIFSPMLGPDGNPLAELFLSDRLHPNAKGYALWTRLIRPYLN